MVTGGRVEFTYRFNYTKSYGGKVTTSGYIYGKFYFIQDPSSPTPLHITNNSPSSKGL